MKNNKKKFLKWFLGLFSVFYFIFSLKIAEAKGILTVLSIVLMVALVVVAFAPYLAPSLWSAVSITAGTTFAQAPLAFIVGATLTTGLVGIAIGQIQCLAGQNNIFFTGCEASGGWGGQSATPGSPILTNESYTATCNSVSLIYDIQNANQYAIYRDGNLVNQGNAQSLSKIFYTDSNLNFQTNYRYVLAMTNNQGEQFQYPEINAYTKCLPECTFGADKEQVVFPAKVNLSWNCQYADSCSISPDVGTVNPQSGLVAVSPSEPITYILTCQNLDGSISFYTSINVINPKIKEVKP